MVREPVLLLGEYAYRLVEKFEPAGRRNQLQQAPIRQGVQPFGMMPIFLGNWEDMLDPRFDRIQAILEEVQPYGA